MPLTTGTRLGPYEVVDKLGEGGMGEVYRARDTSLNRYAALKVLPDGVANDPDRLMRFRREAESLAALNHPNIAQVFGIVEDDTGRPAIAMEFVDGQTLEDAITSPIVDRRSSIEILEWAVPIARQVASALEAAHEKGIVHRDLKPANIKISSDGTVKVLDFGLAKALDQAPGSGDQGSRTSATSPTMTSPALTAMGLILGTAAYMSPEQAKGRPVDRRADIWAFGVVLYEMLTGRRLFQAETVSEVLAAVLREDIDFTALPADTPAAVRRLLTRCLDRDPKTRLRDIGEARIALDAVDDDGTTGDARPPAAARSSWMPMATAAVATAAVVGLLTWALRPEPASVRPIMFELAEGAIAHQAVSPNGNRVAYTTDGERNIWVRDLDTLEPRLVASVERIATIAGPGLFWSWDSSEVGYASDGMLWRVPADGGPPVAICELENNATTGATWGPDGLVVFGSWRGGLYEVPANGTADPALIVETGDDIEDFHGPRFLPNGALVYNPHWVAPHESELHILHNGTTKVLTGISSGSYMQGYLVSGRGGANPGLWAQPFDLDRLELTGNAVLMLAGVLRHAASADGTLVYNTATVDQEVQPSRLGWRDANGDIAVVPGEPRAYLSATLSPDDASVAALVSERDGDAIVIVDLNRGAVTPLVPAAPNERRDVRWSWDGQLVYYAEERGFAQHIVVVPADGSAPPVDVVEGTAPAPSPDGRTLVFERDNRGRQSLWSVPMDGARPAGDPVLLRESPASVEHPAISPDGTLVAYAQGPSMAARYSSDYNVFVSRLDGTGQWPVSVGGGNMPTWDARTGNLIYLTEQAVMTVPVTPGATPDIGDATSLMPLHDAGWLRYSSPRLGLLSDRRRYIAVEAEDSDAPDRTGRLVLVRPWFRDER